MYEMFRKFMHRHFGWHWYSWHHMATWCEGLSPSFVFLRSETFRMCRLCDNKPESCDVEYRPVPIDWLPEDVELHRYY